MTRQLIRFFLVLILTAIALTLHAQPFPGDPIHTFFLIGDAGEPQIEESKIGEVLKRQLDSTKNATVLFLGDNIYPKGLSEEDGLRREAEEKIIQTQVDWVRGLNAKTIFIPGNHDWNHWGIQGYEYVVRQQQRIDSLNDENITFIPKEGCPGPIEVKINDKLLLVILDTQWFLHQWDKPQEDGPCEAKTPAEVIALVEDVFRRHPQKRILVAAHHPIYTYGSHGGVYGWKDHLFPLTTFRQNWYIPMPFFGSLLPVYRKLFGHIQDTAHPSYKDFARPLEEVFNDYPGTVYIAGHEHALQHIEKDSVHYVVSGAGVKVTRTKTKRHAKFTAGVRGFGRLDFFDDGKATLTFFQVDDDFPEGKSIYATVLKSSNFLLAADDTTVVNYRGKVVRVKASDQYQIKPFGRKMLGANYRKTWATELEVPVFDIGREQGGLKILQQGGGQQTLSLRLEDSRGREYVLRSVEKYPEKAVPEMLRKTFAQDLVQDQISASHPYAALIVADLAKAAGIYHTNPRLVFIPDDPRLKEYRRLFSNTLALFEERPAGDWSDAKFFGNSEKIVNTAKVLEKTIEDNDNQVDQEFVLRSRLFDLIIGDWDRHDDQWRWATIDDDKKGKLYRPIPRDRDQAFFVNQGKLSWLWSRRWALPKFEGFDEEIDWPAGLSFNARYFDRSFLNGLSRDQWIDVADNLKKSLTDEEIERAVKKWPEEIYKLDGPTIISNLKKRRDQIIRAAESHYEFLSREVEVVGSDKRERFDIDRLPDGNIRLRVSKIKKDGTQGKPFFDRTFLRQETKELRVFGLGDEDEFNVKGESRRGIKLRVIGGKGKDVIRDESDVKWVKGTWFYDQKGNAEIHSHGEIRDESSKSGAVNVYDRKAFRYNRFAPLLYANFNPDDGLFIGGGFLHIVHGFRKNPYKQRHMFLGSVAPLTQSFNFSYQGRFVQLFGKWNLEVNADLRSPNFVNNFFGFGNETAFNDDIDDVPGIQADDAIDYYRYRFEEIRFEPALSRTFADHITVRIGPAFQRIEMEEVKPDEDRFIEDYAATLDHDLFSQWNAYIGGAFQFNVDARNHPTFTRRGVLWTTSGRSMYGFDNHGGDFNSIESNLSFYYSLASMSRLVLAARIGAGRNTGDYEFYQAQILDGRTELRGYRKTRFYGDDKLFANFEARVKLLNIRTYLFPASLGVLGFYDVGRVWYQDQNGIDPTTSDGSSSRWHRGIGGGIWFTPFNLTVLSAEAARSADGNMVYVRLGFLF